MAAKLALRVLIFRDGDHWIAQVLEKDLVAHGATEYAALTAVQLVLQAHVNFDARNGRPVLSKLPEAPKTFFRAYERAVPLPLPDEWRSLPADLVAAVHKEPLHIH